MKVQGAITFTPLVNASDNDTDVISAIHHDIKGSLGGDMTYTLSANDRWYYAPNVIVTTGADLRLIGGHSDGSTDDLTDLVGASGDPVNGPNEVAGELIHFTDDEAGGTMDTATDDVKFLFVKNTATSDISGTAATDSVYISTTGTTAAYNDKASVEVRAGEAHMCVMHALVKNIVARTGLADAPGGGGGTENVRCVVAAVIADGGH